MEPLTPDDPARIGPFQLATRLGASRNAQIYLGRSARGGAVVVKVVRSEHADDDGVRRRLILAIDGGAAYPRPFTSEVLEGDPVARPPWVAAPYVPGVTLADMVGTYGPLPEAALLLLTAGLLAALADAHAAGLVHGGLEPSNVLLSAKGPRVLDLGTTLTRPARMPTPTRADDVHSFARNLTYAATGTYDDTDGLPLALRETIARCLDDRPEQRPPIVAVAAELGLASPSEGAYHGWLPGDVTLALLDQATTALTTKARSAWRAPAARAAGTGTPRAPSMPRLPYPAALRYRPRPAAPEPPPPPEEKPRSMSRRRLIELGASAAAAVTGTAAGLGLLLREPGPDPSYWRYDTRSSVNSALLVAPKAGLLLCTTFDSSIVALDLMSGSRRWERSAKKSVSGWLALSGGLVLVCMDGALHALDVRTGVAVWTIPGLGWGDVSTDGQSAYIAGKGLTAVDLRTRTIRWRYGRESVSHGVTVSAGRVLAGLGSSISSLDVRTGVVRWTKDAGQYMGAPPVRAGDLVWVGTRVGDLFALDARTGAVRHQILTSGDGSGDANSRVAVAQGVAVVGTTEYEVHGVDTTSGKIRWIYRPPYREKYGGGIDSSPLIDGSTVYIGGGDDHFLALDLFTGWLKWRFRTRGAVDSSPALHGDLIYFGSYDGFIYAVNKATGPGPSRT